MGQSPTKSLQPDAGQAAHHVIGRPKGRGAAQILGIRASGKVQREAQKRVGGREATRLERMAFAPGRNKGEIRKIWTKHKTLVFNAIDREIIREEAKLFRMAFGKSVPDMGKIRRIMNANTKLYPEGLRKKAEKLNLEFGLSGGVPKNKDKWLKEANKVYEEFLKLREPEMVDKYMFTTPEGKQALEEMVAEERKYQERLQGFRKGWVFGTAFVSVKQGVEKIMNDPALRKIYLKTLAIAVGLVPIVGPLISRILNAAAVDMNFDVGDFLRELFAEGVGEIVKLMAMSALESALPPGLNPRLLKVIRFGGDLVTKTVGAAGATALVRGTNKVSKRLGEAGRNSVKKVTG